MELADPVLLHIHAHEVILIRGDPTRLPPSSSYYEVNLTRGDPTGLSHKASSTKAHLSTRVTGSSKEQPAIDLLPGDTTR